MPIWVYIIECKDQFLYTGITGNLENRLQEHREGRTPFTKNKKPIKLIYSERFESRTDAAKKEKEIKGWSR
jgi:putative endonuclease